MLEPQKSGMIRPLHQGAFMSKFDLAELTAGLYEAAIKPELIPAALEGVAKSLGCYSYHQMVLDSQTNVVTVGWTGETVEDSVQAAYENHYIRLDERPIQAFKSGVGGLYFSTDFTSASTIGRSEIYQDFLIPNGVKHTMGGLSYADDKSRVLIAFLGAADRDDFSTEERRHLAQLMPHFNNAASLMFKMQSLERLQADNATLLNALSAAAFTLGANQTIKSMNKRAEALLLHGNFFTIKRQILTAKGPNALEFATLLKRVSRNNEPESMVLDSSNLMESAHVTVTRDQGASLLVLITQPTHHRVATLRQLVQLFRFSPAEAQLARAVAQGQELEAFALSQGVKMTTVRSQMASIFAKAHVKRQAELTRLILSIPCAR
jgi:DNA-binding CsgD family transcriptional regulator